MGRPVSGALVGRTAEDQRNRRMRELGRKSRSCSKARKTSGRKQRSATENATQTQTQKRRMIWQHNSPAPGFKGTKWFHRTNGFDPEKSCSRKKKSSPDYETN